MGSRNIECVCNLPIQPPHPAAQKEKHEEVKIWEISNVSAIFACSKIA